MKPETTFRKRVQTFLDSLSNCEDFSIQQVAIRGDADKILCIHGWFVWLELKDEAGTPAPLQEYKASKVRKAGGITLCTRPSNWEETKRFLLQLNGGVYDQNSLRRTRQDELPTSGAKTGEQSPQGSDRISDQAYDKGRA